MHVNQQQIAETDSTQKGKLLKMDFRSEDGLKVITISRIFGAT